MFLGFLCCVGIMYLLGKYFKYIRCGYEKKIEQIAKFYNNRRFIMTKKYLYTIDDVGVLNALVNDFTKFDNNIQNINNTQNTIEVFVMDGDSLVKMFNLDETIFHQKMDIYKSLIHKTIIYNSDSNEEEKKKSDEENLSNQINDLLMDFDF